MSVFCFVLNYKCLKLYVQGNIMNTNIPFRFLVNYVIILIIVTKIEIRFLRGNIDG